MALISMIISGGIIVIPYIMSYALAHTVWVDGYRMVTYIQFAIAMILVLANHISLKLLPVCLGFFFILLLVMSWKTEKLCRK